MSRRHIGMALYDQSRFLARTAIHRQMSVVPKLYLACRNSQDYGDISCKLLLLLYRVAIETQIA
jgi:hypothetical protein